MKSLKIVYSTNLSLVPKRPKARPIEHYKKQIDNAEKVIKRFELGLGGWVRIPSRKSQKSFKSIGLPLRA